jgi:hypothetical protein
MTYHGAGQYTATWTVGGYPDLNPTPGRQVTRAPNFVCGVVTAREYSARYGAVQCTANTAGIRIYNDAGAAADANFVLLVY